MSSKQNTIFDDPNPDGKPKKQVSKAKKTLSFWWRSIGRLIYLLKNSATLITALMFLWGFLEIYLPPNLKMTTFLVEKIINMKNAEVRRTAKAEADKAETIAAAQSVVELTKTCEGNRLSAAQNAYAACMSQPQALMTGCEFRRQTVLQSMDCHFTADQLSPRVYNHVQQEGVLP